MAPQPQRLTSIDWQPNLLALTFPTGEAPAIANLEGRSGLHRSTDPIQLPKIELPKIELPSIGGDSEKENGLDIPGISESVESKIEGLLKNTLIAIVGIVILAIGLLALVNNANPLPT